MNDIISAIGTVGFPIVMCLLMYKEVDDLRTTIEKNTEIITKLYERMSKDE